MANLGDLTASTLINEGATYFDPTAAPTGKLYWKVADAITPGGSVALSALEFFFDSEVSANPSVTGWTTSTPPDVGTINEIIDLDLNTSAEWINQTGFDAAASFLSATDLFRVRLGSVTQDSFPIEVAVYSSPDGVTWTLEKTITGIAYPGDNSFTPTYQVAPGTLLGVVTYPGVGDTQTQGTRVVTSAPTFQGQGTLDVQGARMRTTSLAFQGQGLITGNPVVIGNTASVAYQGAATLVVAGTYIGTTQVTYPGFSALEIVPTVVPFSPCDEGIYGPYEGWIPGSQPPAPCPELVQAGVATDGVKVWVVTGLEAVASKEATRQVWEYDIAGATWTRLPDLSRRLFGLVVAHYQGALWFYGGSDSDGHGAGVPGLNLDLIRYDLTTYQEEPVSLDQSGVTAPKTNAAYVQVGAKVYIYGGELKGVFSSELKVLDLALLRVTQLQDSSTVAENQGMLGAIWHYDRKLYVLGGLDLERDVINQNLLTYDLVLNTWTELGTQVPTARYGHSYYGMGKKFYMVGGRTSFFGEDKLDEVWEYDAVLATWTQQPKTLATVYSAGACAADNLAVLFGGATAGRNFTKDLYFQRYPVRYTRIRGTVLNRVGNPVAVPVRVYDRPTGQLLEETMSDVTGWFEIILCAQLDPVYLIASAETTAWNASIVDMIQPT